jgi:putative peptide zinc metalloprotease protein
MQADLATPLAEAPPAKRHTYRIRDGVTRVVRKDAILLISPTRDTPVRLSPIAEELMPLLARGAEFDQLAAKLQVRHPTATDLGAKLTAFLAQLQKAEVLESAPAARTRRARPRFVLGHPDPAARAIAAALARTGWVGRITWHALLLAAVVGIAALAWAGRAPRPDVLFTRFDGWGLAIFALLVVPLHEFSHAIACRLAGAPVGAAGILFHGWIVPGPFVETTGAYRVASRARRFWIPAAGPAIDLLAAGAAAWGLLWAGDAHPALTAALAIVFVLSAAFVYLDTNPLGPSDGSHMLEAVLDDELARRSALSRTRARLSSRWTVSIYRTVATLHLQAAIVVAWLWWSP